MSHGSEVRKRKTDQLQRSNGIGKYEEDNKAKDPDFVPRESPLTVLIENSMHIRAIYHIFVVILLVLLVDTVIYDLVEKGKIAVGTSAVVHGFGDVRRGIELWIFEFLVVLAFYPALRIYGYLSKLVLKIPGFRGIWVGVGAAGLVGIQVLLFAYPVWDLTREHLAIGSSATVTCEMFRFAMKIHAVAIACGPRCFGGNVPLPSFKHYLYFLFAPTLVYRDYYPRTKNIKWGKVLFHLLEVAAIVIYESFLWERFILPYWSDFGKSSQIEAGLVVRAIFACVLPGMLSFLCGFYLLLHTWLNAWAELLTFADRLFYEEWWTSSRFSRFYRAWNRVVHSWLRDQIHQPTAPVLGRAGATVTVFVVSAIAHEVIIALSFGFFYPVLLMEFGLCGLLMVPLTAASGRLFPNFFNIIMWLSFFLGNGLIWSLYPMEYFARKNCPPSENDSFFIPKSWSCPEIVLKPNWTFQNPFSLFY